MRKHTAMVMNITRINHTLKLLTIIVAVFFMGYFLESYGSFSPVVGDFFEISTQLLPFVVSISIFVITWNAYAKNRDNNSLFLGAAFLVIGVFYLYYLLSLPFMPDFITHNSSQKAAVFWGGAELITPLLFLASVFIHRDSFPRLINKPVMLVSVNVFSIIFLNTVLFYNDYLPATYNPDGSFSAARLFLTFSASLIILCASYLYSRRIRKTGEKNLICLIHGFIIIASSDLFYLNYDYSGHLLRAAGYYFVYLALFRSAIEQPYETQVAAKKKLLYETEEKYRNLFDNANDAILTTDTADRITSWNRSAEIIFGWKAEEVTGSKLSKILVPPDMLTESECLTSDTMAGKAVSGVETVRLRMDGTCLDVSLTISPLRDTDQKIIGRSCVIRDITERKRAENEIKASLKEKEILLREIHHRVKNNMQIISSLLRLQAGYVKEEKYLEMFKDSQNRIISMSIIHEKLYQSRDFSRIDFNEYIKDMVNGLYQSYGPDTGRIALHINVEDVSLGVDTAIPCGLIINELVTNSLKHAFPGNRKGKINISLFKKGDEYELAVSDNGVCIPKDVDFRNTQSLGLHLVTILAENQLQGNIHLDRSNGTEFQIKFKGEKYD